MATIIKWIQKIFPRGVRATRGYCLKFVDDEARAPKRTATARVAMGNESKAGRLSTSNPPVGVWVCVYLRLNKNSSYDHVGLGLYKGNGKWEIRDSESESGYRSRYTTIASWLAWFTNYAPVYKGWSYMTDGAVWAKKQTTTVTPPKPAEKKYYAARSGDTVDSISRRYNLKIDYSQKSVQKQYPGFKKLNPNVKDVNKITAGQKYRVK